MSKPLSRFGLNATHGVLRLDDQIDFGAPVFAEVEQVRGPTAVHRGLPNLRRDPAFEDCPAKGMEPELARLADSEQPTDQAGVHEVEFGSLDRSLP